MLKLLFALGIVPISIVAAIHFQSKNDVTFDCSTNYKFYSILLEFGSVYVARKIDGPDAGNLYALKAVNVTDVHLKNEIFDKDPLNTEREILQAIRGLPWVIKLHYSFREGTWLFLVMDLVNGENLRNKLDINLPDAAAARLILAEIVIIIEELHDMNVLHGDVHVGNFLVNREGHFVLIDFGFSDWLSSDEVSQLDWQQLSRMCYHIFPEPIHNENQLSLIKMLSDMTDAQLPELKNHSYFNGIEWENVERRSVPLYEPIYNSDINQIDFENPLDLAAALEISIDDQFKANLVNRFGNYSFVAAEHQTISLKHFSVFNELGKGSYGTVFLAKKNGGSDNGKLYALKAVNILYTFTMKNYFGRDTLDNEREILEAVRGLRCASGLQYAFREGTWLFLVMDLVIGETLRSKLDVSSPNRATARLILAELVVAVEKLHNLNIQHGDLASAKNIIIDNEGHLVLIDFGLAQRFPSHNTKHNDWIMIHRICQLIFPFAIDTNWLSLGKLLGKMTDSQLPELKKHPFFDGINWRDVAKHQSHPPYDPSHHMIQINLDKPIDLTTILMDGINEVLDESLLNRFRNYTFVAPEHRI